MGLSTSKISIQEVMLDKSDIEVIGCIAEEVKKHEVGFSMYPLCIDTLDKSDEEIQNFDATTGAIVCVEGGKRNSKALSIIVESKIGNSYYIPEME
uniref:Uncharacterized protein n=1 Tax=Solanum demissum TaxID=50514 RepID=Q0KIU4_SOLDE|nr:hypothetical protein SDM1_25t00019 [Solanum demissum]